MLKFGLVGVGKWGVNYLRVLLKHSEIDLIVVCDFDEPKTPIYEENQEKIIYTNDYKRVLNYEVNAVIIATPPITHYEIAKFFLNNNTHVLCEKPLTITSKSSKELNILSNIKGLVLLTGYTFLYNDSIKYIKNYLLSESKQRDIKLMKFSRLNLGPIRKKVNVMFDLATHDIAIAVYLLNQMPKFVSAQGFSFEKNNKEDWFQIQLFFDESIVNIECFWLYQVKERKVSIHIKDEVILFDDLAKQQVKIYRGKGNLTENPLIENLVLPSINVKEPLLNLIETFIDLISSNSKFNYEKNAHFESLIVGILETAMKSKNESGVKIPFKL